MDPMEKLRPSIVYMPCIGCVFCILAFVICFILTAIYDRLPDWLIFPPISLLGYHYPEHFVYAILFTCGAICFFISFLYIRKFALKCHGLYFDSFRSKWLDAAVILAIISPAFLTIQAIIPLQSDILDANAKLTIWSIIHQGSAVVLFLFATIHGIIVNWTISHTPGHTIPKLSIILKTFGLIIMILSLIGSIIFHPASNAIGSNSALVMNMAGILQWLFVAAMMIYYGSYTVDFKPLHIE